MNPKMKRPSLNRDWRVERKSSSEPTDLDRGLSNAIEKSLAAISDKVDAIIREKYKAVIDHARGRRLRRTPLRADMIALRDESQQPVSVGQPKRRQCTLDYSDEVTKEQVEAVEESVRKEFERGNWITVSEES